ncbi:hypothetical protein ThrDRAFT_03362 [Frankia casuarinae]|uniref:16S rRNA (guanine(1405)-N(7))-methyltransferase n=1 Tax=Frankia casuarinae (strain DSM 45818 / CECT 9043 / HFP020203 / CcI3) TaxID=106370 RepID=Q2J7K5_FRACC|nr:MULTISPECIES: 16S rRNA methyltransferase [Frankia]ABD12737.1 ribosomal RNA methyltransferase [Frankia casuarinae]ESZ99856.1 hypothetical protein CcI6DRAFT_04732 [Frankia sp. CcI6]EYT91028.1 hypothetical protein ThrDRAFT_03362 [Frankia casuarinae]KEZ37037.1 Ribosomal RNA methyltransferase (FmrO) [Frankia sp. CeD]KFB02579.1 Ribosomal RNA methyltransferase (FmrO) [Frankia sp. Allo2]
MTPPGADQEAVAAAAARIARSAKYRGVHPETIAHVVEQEASAGGTGPVEHRARVRLHRVAALHLLSGRTAVLRREVARLPTGDPQALKAGCRAVLARHVSTAERLADLDDFYPALLSILPAPDTVVDIACALNVLTVPWLLETCDATYTGYDLNADFVEIGNAFLAMVHPQGWVVHHDVVAQGPPPRADLALLLKTYHCLEDRRRGSGLRLVETVDARHVAVSFPTRAMNGRPAVFAPPMQEELERLADRRGWSVDRVRLSTEELVVLGRSPQDMSSPEALPTRAHQG